MLTVVNLVNLLQEAELINDVQYVGRETFNIARILRVQLSAKNGIEIPFQNRLISWRIV